MLWLTGASPAFYAIGSWAHLLIFVGSIAANYHLSLAMGNASSDPKKKKTLFITGIALNLGILFLFKYLNFTTSTLESLTGLPLELPPLTLPLAISFFTFQQIAYLSMIFRSGHDKANALEYVLYVSFFPQLIAGPIVKPDEIIPQLKSKSFGKLNSSNLVFGINLLVIGLAKKLLIADSLALIADPLFAQSSAGNDLAATQAWIAITAFTFQIYYDFSSYSDMALGLARCFNLKLPENFASPYRASSIIDFWRRWHITLSNLLRDFIYIPLGGNRLGSQRTLINLMTTMLLAGLWHGANWTFIIWGALHGLFLIINHWWRTAKFRTPQTISWAITFLCVCLSWTLFRANSLEEALRLYGNLFGSSSIFPGGLSGFDYLKTLGIQERWSELHFALHSLGLYPDAKNGLHLGTAFFSDFSWSIITIVLSATIAIAFRRPMTWLSKPINDSPKFSLLGAILLGLLCAFTLVNTGEYQATPFIYFRF